MRLLFRLGPRQEIHPANPRRGLPLHKKTAFQALPNLSPTIQKAPQVLTPMPSLGKVINSPGDWSHFLIPVYFSKTQWAIPPGKLATEPLATPMATACLFSARHGRARGTTAPARRPEAVVQPAAPRIPHLRDTLGMGWITVLGAAGC